MLKKMDENTNIHLDVDLLFDDDADFDYLTSSSCIHDGTLLFVEEAMNECIRNICIGHDYNRDIGEARSSDRIKYVIGNFVILNEYDGAFVPRNKPWMRERTTVLLPFELIKN